MPILDALGVLPRARGAGLPEEVGRHDGLGHHARALELALPRDQPRSFPTPTRCGGRPSTTCCSRTPRRRGPTVREGCRVLGVLFEGDRAVGVRFADEAGRGAAARGPARRGRQRPGRPHRPRARPSPRRTRTSATWPSTATTRAPQRLPEPDDTNIFIESFEHGWFWNIPLHTGWMSVGAVVDAGTGRRASAAWARRPSSTGRSTRRRARRPCSSAPAACRARP